VIVETQIKNTLSPKDDVHGKDALCWPGCPQKNHCFCVKQIDGKVTSQGTIDANRAALKCRANTLPYPWVGALDAAFLLTNTENRPSEYL